MDVDHGLLRALAVLLKERNVTRAAIALGITQSSLSARLKRLRKIFGDPLFVTAASGRGIVATPRALELQAELGDVLERLDAILAARPSFEPAHSQRTFVIGVLENPAAIVAPGLVARVAATAPNVRLAFVNPSRMDGEPLESGRVDLLVSGSEDETGDLMKRPLFEDDFVCALRKGHPRGEGHLTLEDYCELDHAIVSTEGSGFSGVVDQLLAECGRARAVKVSLQNYALVPLVLAGSDCICTLPRRFLSRFSNELDLITPPLSLPTIRLAALWHRRNQNDPGHIWLRERLYESLAAG